MVVRSEPRIYKMGQTPNGDSACRIRQKQSSACRAELGRYQLIIKIQKIAVKFYNHLKGSDSQAFHNKAITYREINPGEEPPKQAGPGALFTNTNRPQRTKGQQHN